MYGEKVAEASALIREFAKVDYFHFLQGDPEKALEAFIAMLDQAEEKGRQSQAARIAELERENSSLAYELNKVASAQPQQVSDLSAAIMNIPHNENNQQSYDRHDLRVAYKVGHRDARHAAAELALAASQHKAGVQWVIVNDRRPTDHAKCYLVASNWGIRFARKHEDNWANGCFQDTDTDSDEGMLGWDEADGVFTVTHWCELPPPPTTEVEQSNG